MINNFPHLQSIKLELPDEEDFSVLIGADMPHLHMYTDTQIGEKDQAIALLATHGWVLMGGKSNSNYPNNKVSLNLLKRKSQILNKSIERFWQIESDEVLKRDDSILIPK